MRPHLILLSAAALPLAGCSDLFYAEVEEPKICLTLVGETIPGVPAAPEDMPIDPEDLPDLPDLPLDLSEQERDLAYDLGPALPEEFTRDNVEMKVELLSFELMSGAGSPPLDFLENAELGLVDGETVQPLASWQREGDEPVETAAFQVKKGFDFGHAVNAARVMMQLSVRGVLPEEDWSADARACFRVSGRIHYLE